MLRPCLLALTKATATAQAVKAASIAAGARAGAAGATILTRSHISMDTYTCRRAPMQSMHPMHHERPVHTNTAMGLRQVRKMTRNRAEALQARHLSRTGVGRSRGMTHPAAVPWSSSNAALESIQAPAVQAQGYTGINGARGAANTMFRRHPRRQMQRASRSSDRTRQIRFPSTGKILDRTRTSCEANPTTSWAPA